MASKVCIATQRLAAMMRLRRRPAVTTALTYTLPIDRPVEEEQIPEYDSTQFCPVVPGQIFNGRYEAISKLGWGTTSTVWLARDLDSWRWQPERMVTLKLINRSTHEANKVEHELMMSQRQINANPNHMGYALVRTCIDNFMTTSESAEHMCLVYKPMRETLNSYRRRFNPGGLPLPLVKAYVKILLMGLDFLHSECKTIHTDLKLDNILVNFEDMSVLEDYTEYQLRADSPCKESNGRLLFESKHNFGPLLSPVVTPRIADFGLAQEVNDGGNPFIHPIQPDHYRAPEVIVGGSWDYSVDIWNFGVMIWSLAGNTELFQPVSTSHGRYSAAKHLAQMTALLGPAPPAFVARQAKGQEWRWRPAIPNDAGKLCDRVSDYFGGPFFDQETGEFLYQHLIPENRTLAESINFIDKDEEKVEFMRFIRQMLQWEPEKRKTARELFDDPWLVNTPRRESSGTKAG